LLAHGRWFSPASSNTKTGRHDITEILLKVVLNTKNSKIKIQLVTNSPHFVVEQTVDMNLLMSTW
jgi:hypothetical protein